MSEPMLKEVPVREAVGMVLAHDLTQIIPGQFKGRLFRKGHVVTEADIDKLLDIGKEHIYILNLGEDYAHEDEAAERLALAAAGDGTERTEPHEGKVTLKARIRGLAKVDRAFVDRVNALEAIVLSTRRGDAVVQPGDALAGARVIPLAIERERIAAVERLAEQYRREHGGHGPVRVAPLRPLRAGLITTGGEVFSGRIADKFGPAVRRKLEELGASVVEQRFAPDDSGTIVGEIRHFADRGVDLILLTGGMSVDPDDRTPGAIRKSGAEVVSYGTPMLPGSMLMMAYLPAGGRRIPVMGLPGCVMHDPFTSFDVLLPKVLAGEEITREFIAGMGYGGLLGC